MTRTTCKQHDCLNFYVRREHTGAENGGSCLASIREPRSNCERYTAPSWKPFHKSARLKKG